MKTFKEILAQKRAEHPQPHHDSHMSMFSVIMLAIFFFLRGS